jgi:glycosyltransferase involved in cell wall biosynthesis
MSTPGGRKIAMVPALNEEGSVAEVVEELRREAPDFDVLVVDDGSTDATARRARAAGAIVLTHPFNLGIGGAVQSGYRYAHVNGYEVAVQVDGDGQHDPAQIKKLEQGLSASGADLVWGSRFLEQAGYAVPRLRRAGRVIFARIVSAITREPVTDPTSGFRIANRRGIELFARDYPHDYPEVEAILMAHGHDLEISEVAVTMRQRETGSSSINMANAGYYMVRVLLAIFVGLFRRRPLPPPGEEWLPTSPSGAFESTQR